tara:strand:- start:359 stop:460 length:102 start_codon:yes stop_codon:yes gene_type:complete
MKIKFKKLFQTTTASITFDDKIPQLLKTYKAIP